MMFKSHIEILPYCCCCYCYTIRKNMKVNSQGKNVWCQIILNLTINSFKTAGSPLLEEPSGIFADWQNFKLMSSASIG